MRTTRQRGVTLTELMIALVLGALVVLAATAMVVTSRGTYRSQDEGTRLAESARFGLELSNRLVRLAGYTNFGNDVTPPASYTIDPTWTPTLANAYALNGPNLVGADDSRPVSGAPINHSDALTIRFFGSSASDSIVPDGNVLDCAGFAVPQPQLASGPTAPLAAIGNNSLRSYNVLFVDTDTDGEPSLKCQRQAYDASWQPNGTDTQTLIRGVEVFKVLYGELIPQGPPADDLDLNPPAQIVYRTGIGGANPVQHWNNVRSVRIAMLLRSATGTRPEAEPSATVYHLFGDDYAASSTADPGASFSLSSLGNAERTRARRIVETTVFIRNRQSDWQSVFVN